MKRRVVIIGGGAAGMSAAAKARRTDAELDIVVYERSGFVSYGACGFPYAIKGEIARIEDVIVRTPEQFARQGIQALIHHEVLAIDTERQTVRVRDLTSGREFVDHWDELVLTTGGQPVRPRSLASICPVFSHCGTLRMHRLSSTGCTNNNHALGSSLVVGTSV